MRELLNELTTALEQQRACVWCAVVETRGSTPQKAGAVMLVFPDGGQRGTLGGGCVEAEVKQRALRVLNDARGTDLKSVLPSGGRAELLTFHLDDNYGWDDGLICGGRMTILADSVGGRNAEAYYRRYQQIVESGLGCTEVIALEENSLGLSPGTRFLFDAGRNLIGQVGEAVVPADLVAQLRPLSERPRPTTQRGLSFLTHLPRVTLLIVGGGHVGAAVARLAAEVDFEVWVLDDRERYVARDRFPSAHKLIAGDIGERLKELAPALDASTFSIIVTRGHNHDEEALYHLAPSKAGYVGMIGSRRKIKLIFEDLIAKGITPEMLARVHAPLGYDIGSQTVPEIAVSIVAELLACRNLGSSELPPRRRIGAETVRP